jgi:hypothetical protein
MWTSVKTARGYCQWRKATKKSKSKAVKRKSKSKSKSKARSRSKAKKELSWDDWTDLADKKKKFITLKKIANMKVGDSIKIINVDQGADRPEVWTKDESCGVADGEFRCEDMWYDSQMGGNYEGLAVTGSGSDRWMLWSNYQKMPKIAED